jgi:hypothetical protein
MGLSKIIRLLPPVFCAVAGAQAHAAEPQALTLAPTSEWVVDYAEDNCALQRSFAAGGDTATLTLRAFSPGDSYEATIVSDTFPRTRRAPRIRYRSDESWYEPWAPPNFVKADARPGVIFSDSLRPAALKPRDSVWPTWADADRDARERAVTEFAIANDSGRELALQTGAMHRPMEALRACLRELVTHWGLDSAVQETLSRKVTPVRQADWARRVLNAYPVAMLRAGKSGRVPIRVIVGTDGKTVSCIAYEGFADPAFGQAACSSMMRHSRFEPALDAAGQPVVSYWVTTIVYQVGR